MGVRLNRKGHSTVTGLSCSTSASASYCRAYAKHVAPFTKAGELIRQIGTLYSHTVPSGGTLEGLSQAQDSILEVPERLIEGGRVPAGAVWGSGKGPRPLTQMPGPAC